LRNPLAPIGAAAALLKMGKSDTARVRQTSEIISRQVAHMTNLVDDLLDVSRVTRGLVTLEQAPLDMGHIINDAVEQASPLIRNKGHALTLQLCPGVTTVMGDNKRLVQIVSNLLNNAAKYTPAGGAIVLRTEVDEAMVYLTVSDNGIGIERALAARVFDLFTQAEPTPDRSSGGLGLGLALVKNLVELHGGAVSCTSAGAGMGSTFRIALPRLAAVTLRASPAAAAAPARGAARRILLVDDNVDAATMLGMLLDASGHAVTVVHSSSRALESVAVDHFDACLLDIGLPDMDGNELARRLRTDPRAAGCKLIAITGYGQQCDRENTSAAGFDHHLIKPVDMHKLLALLDGMGETAVLP
jgi:CheY-like chemotaxis protein